MLRGRRALWAIVDPLWHLLFARLSRRGLLTYTNDDAFRLDVRFGSPYGRHDPRVYEPELYRAFTEALRPGMHVFDIGADIGLYTLAAAKRLDRGKVYAFEPNEQRAAIIRRHIALNRWHDRAEVITAAVSDDSGHVPFYVTRWTMAASLSRRNAEMVDDSRAEVMTVECISVDEFCERTHTWPDVLKIDAEGAELLVLRGARRLLRDRDPIIFCEVHPAQMRNCGASRHELELFLAELGYTLEPLGLANKAGIFHSRLRRPRPNATRPANR